MCLDFDRFKEVNDVYGHAAGDELLRAVSTAPAGRVGGAFLARLGGDEFVVIATDGEQRRGGRDPGRIGCSPRSTRRSRSTAIRCASASASASRSFPVDGADAATLLGNADAALYRAKAEGRGIVRFFEAEMDQQLRERRVLQQELRSAIERGELRPALPAAGAHRRRDLRLRGAGALAASAARPGPARHLHSARRGERPDRRDRRMDPARACREAASWPQAAADRDQSVAGAVPPRRSAGARAFGAARDRPAAVAARARDHRRRADRRLLARACRSCAGSRRSACASPWTISAPATRRCPICSRSRSTRSRSTAPSSPISAHNQQSADHRPRGDRAWRAASSFRCSPKASRPRSSWRSCAEESCDEIQGYLIGRPLPIEDYAALTGQPKALRKPAPRRAARRRRSKSDTADCIATCTCASHGADKANAVMKVDGKRLPGAPGAFSRGANRQCRATSW